MMNIIQLLLSIQGKEGDPVVEEKRKIEYLNPDRTWVDIFWGNLESLLNHYILHGNQLGCRECKKFSIVYNILLGKMFSERSFEENKIANKNSKLLSEMKFVKKGGLG